MGSSVSRLVKTRGDVTTALVDTLEALVSDADASRRVLEIIASGDPSLDPADVASARLRDASRSDALERARDVLRRVGGAR